MVKYFCFENKSKKIVIVKAKIILLDIWFQLAFQHTLQIERKIKHE